MLARFYPFAVLALCSVSLGCSPSETASGVKVTGKVAHAGNPVAGARVVFTDGADPGTGPRAITDDAGNYEVTGVKPGAYKVVVYKLLPPKGSTMPPESLDLEQIEASGAGAHALPKVYAKPNTTTLTAQVDASATTANFDLVGTAGK